MFTYERDVYLGSFHMFLLRSTLGISEVQINECTMSTPLSPILMPMTYKTCFCSHCLPLKVAWSSVGDDQEDFQHVAYETL